MNRILYLHGFASGPASAKGIYFRDFLAREGATVEIPDLAGGDFEHLTITGQLRVIERTAGEVPVSLIGSSMGGYLAALYAAHNSQIERVVLLAPAFGFARRWMAEWGEERLGEWRRNRSLEIYHYGYGRNVALDYGLIEDALRYPDGPAFSQPALIFHGAGDVVVPAAVSQCHAGNNPNAHLEIVDSDHELRNVLEYMAPKVATFLLGK